jgi:hypothetical protein
LTFDSSSFGSNGAIVVMIGVSFYGWTACRGLQRRLWSGLQMLSVAAPALIRSCS